MTTHKDDTGHIFDASTFHAPGIYSNFLVCLIEVYFPSTLLRSNIHSQLCGGRGLYFFARPTIGICIDPGEMHMFGTCRCTITITVRVMRGNFILFVFEYNILSFVFRFIA